MITALEAARVTIRAQHPEVPATVVITGAGDNQKGHAAADMAGVPDMLGCPVRELADEPTPALRRPARRGPARTRCSVHPRPVEHATNRQRVIGVIRVIEDQITTLRLYNARYTGDHRSFFDPICGDDHPYITRSALQTGFSAVL